MKSRINYWVELRGYKKKWVAQQMEVSQEVLSRWLNDKSRPSLENAFRLAEILDCKVDDLYKRQQEIRNENPKPKPGG